MKDETITYTMMLLYNWSLIRNLCQFSISFSCVPSHMSRTSSGSYMTINVPNPGTHSDTRVYIWKWSALLFLDPDQKCSVLQVLSFDLSVSYILSHNNFTSNIHDVILRNIGIVFNGTDFHRARDAFVLIKINIYCCQARQGMRLGALSSDFSLWFCVYTKYNNNSLLFSASTNILIYWIVTRTCRMRAILRGHDGSDHQILSKLTTVGCEGCDLVIKVRGEFFMLKIYAYND